MESYGTGLHHRTLGETDLCGQWINDMLGNCDILSKSAVLVVFTARNPQHPAMIAQVDVSSVAVKAGTAIHGGVKGHPFTRLDICDV